MQLLRRGLLNVSAFLAAVAVAVLAMIVVGRAGAGAGRAARLQTDKLFRNRQRQNLMHSLVCAAPRIGGSKPYSIYTKP